jgi:hypothetical protein
MMFALLLRPPRVAAQRAADRPRRGLVAEVSVPQPPTAALTVVEIDAAVVRPPRSAFQAAGRPRRFAIEIADGHDYVTSTDRQFDLILVDGFDAKCNVGMLDTLPFYCGCRARLTDEGTLLSQLSSTSAAVLRRKLKRLDSRVRLASLRAACVLVGQHHRCGRDRSSSRRVASGAQGRRAGAEAQTRAPTSSPMVRANRRSCSGACGSLRALDRRAASRPGPALRPDPLGEQRLHARIAAAERPIRFGRRSVPPDE